MRVKLNVAMLGMVLALITACAPRTVAPPNGTAAPTSADGGLTVIPADMTPLPTEIVATIPAPDHADFREADINAEPWAGIRQKITDAFAAGESWAEDPDQLSMEFSVNPTALVQGEVIQRSDTHAILLVTEFIEGDDSIAEQQTIVEMSRASATDVWVVDWIGQRWKCREGRGQQDWAPDLCV